MHTRLPRLITLFAAIISVTALAQTAPSTAPSTAPADSESSNSKGGFSAKLVFVDVSTIDNPRDLDPAKLTAAKVVERNKPHVAVIFFSGATANEKGNADVTYDLTFRAPDGSIAFQTNGQRGWDRKLPEPGKMQAVLSPVPVTVESNDPAGRWTVEAVVHENVKKIDLPLKAPFEVK
jgi:hypothetical protein